MYEPCRKSAIRRNLTRLAVVAIIAGFVISCGSKANNNVTGPTTPTGGTGGSSSAHVLFWTKADSGWASIPILFDGVAAGTLTQFRTAGPTSCSTTTSASGVLVTANAGAHSYSAKSDTNISWSDSITLTSGQCVFYELKCGPDVCNTIPKTYSGRPVQYQGTVDVNSRNVVFEVWDSGTIDGDIISLVVNGNVVLSQFTLAGPQAKKAIPFTLPTTGSNYVLLFAHNVGSIPPNTAALSITENGITHDLVISADLQTNGAYNIVVH